MAPPMSESRRLLLQVIEGVMPNSARSAWAWQNYICFSCLGCCLDGWEKGRVCKRKRNRYKQEGVNIARSVPRIRAKRNRCNSSNSGNSPVRF